MPDEFQFKVTEDVLHLAIKLDHLDANCAAKLKQELNSAMTSPIRKADVEMGSVQFIDSSGIGFLLSIYRKLPQDEAEVILRNVQPGVKAVIELLRLHRVFQFR